MLQSIQQLAFSFSELNQPYIRTNKKIEEKLFERINQEKRQFANFLHDNILQSIISLNNLSSTLHGDYRIKNLIQIEFAKLTYSIRKQITDQTPSSIYLLPLETNLNILFEDLHGRFPDINFQLHFTLEKELPEHSIPVVFRIIRELNLNIAKHSSATLGQTSLKINDNCLEIRVLDNGIGIKNIQQLKQNLIQKGSHFGLLTIKNDIALLGGHFSIQTTPTIKQGTEIIINIPIELEV